MFAYSGGKTVVTPELVMSLKGFLPYRLRASLKILTPSFMNFLRLDPVVSNQVGALARGYSDFGAQTAKKIRKEIRARDAVVTTGRACLMLAKEGSSRNLKTPEELGIVMLDNCRAMELSVDDGVE